MEEGWRETEDVDRDARFTHDLRTIYALFVHEI